ncbi:MAG: ribonuclease Z [Thermodesulfovibrionales bacterium]
MKPSFHHRLINGPSGDPVLLVSPWREKRKLLFDIGDISAMSAGDKTGTTDVFVSHLHIDHFIGFDALLRAILRRAIPLSVYGPSPIIRAVEHRIAGFTWNLIREYPVSIDVFEYTGRRLLHASFSAKSGMRKVMRRSSGCNGVLLETPHFQVRTVRLDHGIPCLAFLVEEKLRITIDKACLSRMGLPVGPWLAELKKRLREPGGLTRSMTIRGKRYSVKELASVARTGDGMKIGYATDLAPTGRNIRKLVELVRGADVLYCEAAFLEEDRKQAVSRNHLTALDCGILAREAGVSNIVPIHFSPRYKGREDELRAEVRKGFMSVNADSFFTKKSVPLVKKLP